MYWLVPRAQNKSELPPKKAVPNHHTLTAKFIELPAPADPVSESVYYIPVFSYSIQDNHRNYVVSLLSI